MKPSIDLSPAKRGWRFAGYTVDVANRQLLDPKNHPLEISGPAFSVLVALVEKAGAIIDKYSLMEQVWPDRVVEENNLTQAISSLRKILGGDALDRRFIITVPGRGYQFVTAVEALAQPTPGTDSNLYSRWRDQRQMALFSVLAVTTAVFIAWWLGRDWGAVSSAREAPSVAVMPFRALSVDQDDELLTVGLADTLISRLSRSAELKVLSLSSTGRFDPADPLAAGRKLGVRWVVDGSTQKRDALLRINIRLLDITQGTVAWADTFDTQLEYVFTAQDSIANALARELGSETIPTPLLSPCEGSDPAAYRANLLGRQFINSPVAGRLDAAEKQFQLAIEMDPLCANAWAGQAFIWRARSITGNMDPAESFPRSEQAWRKALELDPQLSFAYVAKGFNEFWYGWDWDAAETSLMQAITLNPSQSEAWLALAHLRSNLGRHQEALHDIRRASELDPVSPLIGSLEGSFLHAAGLNDEAMNRINQVLELSPGFWIALLVRGTIVMDSGRPASALDDLEVAAANSSRAMQALSLLGNALARSGRTEEAEALLAEFKQHLAIGYVPPTALASVLNGLEREEEALDELEAGFERRDIRIAWLKVDHRWDNLREHPRFITLMQRLRFPEP